MTAGAIDAGVSTVLVEPSNNPRTFGSVGVTIVQGRKAASITLNPEQVRAFVARLTKAAGK